MNVYIFFQICLGTGNQGMRLLMDFEEGSWMIILIDSMIQFKYHFRDNILVNSG
jgi:hypothetical protein